MGQILTPDHFETAKQRGIDHFADAYGECIGEMSLTLPKLEEAQGPLAGSKEDLMGYWFVQYGTPYEIASASLDAVREGRLSHLYSSELTKLVNGAIEHCYAPCISLGRIALGNCNMPAILKDLGDIRDIAAHRPGAQKGGRFFYPSDDLELFYRGRHTVDLMQPALTNNDETPTSPARELYRIQYQRGRMVLSALKVHTDLIEAHEPDGEILYIAQSITEDWDTKLVSISEEVIIK
jgi:hypothetical protein